MGRIWCKLGQLEKNKRGAAGGGRLTMGQGPVRVRGQLGHGQRKRSPRSLDLAAARAEARCRGTWRWGRLDQIGLVGLAQEVHTGTRQGQRGDRSGEPVHR